MSTKEHGFKAEVQQLLNLSIGPFGLFRPRGIPARVDFKCSGRAG